MNKNDVVIVQLDRQRELRFGHKALKRLSAFTGQSVEEMESGNFDFDQIEEIFFYGLQQDAKENGEQLSLDDMEDILDCAESYDYLIEKMNEAINKAMGNFGGNSQAAGKPQPKGNHGTGRNR